MTLIAHGCRVKASRADTARVRIASFQLVPGVGELDLCDHDVDDAVEQVVLVAHVVVERHCLDAEALAELAHAERGEAVLVGVGSSGAQHPLSIERGAGRFCGHAVAPI